MTATLKAKNDSMIARAIVVVEAAREQHLIVRIMGGCATLLRAPDLSDWLASKGRRLGDVDFVCRRSDRLTLPELMGGLGYSEDARLNALHGRVRNVFFGAEGEERWEADIFFDQLPMCHVLDFEGRLELDSLTLSPVDLLMTKLQIIELNEKDGLDICCLLAAHPVSGSEEGAIDGARLVELTSDDWGFFHTVELNLARVTSILSSSDFPAPWREQASNGLSALSEGMNSAGKSLRWKIRSRLGEKMRWYNLVEDVRR